LFENAFGQLHAHLQQWTVQDLASELQRLHMPMTCGPTRPRGQLGSEVGRG
jgi:hypothetical protein